MPAHSLITRLVKTGLVLGVGSAIMASRASHDYQLHRFSLKAAGEDSARRSLTRGTQAREDWAQERHGSKATEPRGAALRILQLSDTHLYRGREDLVAWLRLLAGRAFEDYELVILTGDMLATRFGDEELVSRALKPFIESGIPGAYVFGAHDFYGNHFGNPLKYLARRLRQVTGEKDESELRPREVHANGETLRGLLEDSDWLDLNNRNASLEIAGWRVEFSGVGDAHIRRDQFVGFASSGGVSSKERGSAGAKATLGAKVFSKAPTLRIGLSHAPYTRVLDEFARAGADLVFCGHTHGGQVCLPGGIALVSNCDLSPRFASGVFSWSRQDPSGLGEPVVGVENPGLMRVCVSPGLGTSPFTPWRVFCPPAAFLVELHL